MTSAERQLKTIGFGRQRREPVCWRAVRLDPPVRPAHDCSEDQEPADSRALALWREVLARNPRPSPYRIRRVAR
jgi:hypothetical protein